MNNQVGQDSTGQWTPAQYAIDAGWDYTCIEATAARGVSEEDADGLTAEQQAALLDFCRGRVADKAEADATEWDATEWVYEQDERDDHHDDSDWDAALRRAFVALYRREPSADDEQAGLWSLCCAACPGCGTRQQGI
jgi:hypothetical protein